MRIDPHAWLLTAPLTVTLVRLYFLPAESFAKRCWRQVTEAETVGWERLVGRSLRADQFAMRKAVFCIMLLALLLSSAASFAVFIGLLPGR